MAPATKVKVLHRATEDITDGRNTSTSPCAKASESETQLKQLQAENESLKQRLEQVTVWSWTLQACSRHEADFQHVSHLTNRS